MTKRGRRRGQQPKKLTRPKAATKKERMTMVWVDFGKEQVLSGMSLPNQGGELIFYDEKGQPVRPKHIEVGVGYQRTKGAKVITRAKSNPAVILTAVNNHLAGYSWVFAVDTNTRTVGPEAISVTAIVLLRDILVTGQRWSAKVVPQAFFEARDAQVPPERLGWRHLIWMIKKSYLEGQIAIFVDSELEEITGLNRRERELLPGFLLPENVVLLYASSDVGREELIGNKAIAECDREARDLIARIEAGEAPVRQFQEDMPRFCRRYRLWEPKIGWPRATA